MQSRARKRIAVLLGVLRGDRSSRYLAMEQLDLRLNPDHFFGEEDAVWFPLAREQFPADRFGAWNLHRRWDRLWNLGQFARVVGTLEGDTIEFGCHAGASSFVILSTLSKGRHWCIDSFEGLSDPNPVQDGYSWHSGDLAVAEEVLIRNLAEFSDRICVVRGWIPEVLESLPADAQFRFAHIDVDLYTPTAGSLEYLARRMVSGGIIVCDDYGSGGCPGARRAVDEFVDRNPSWMVLHLSSTQAVIMQPPYSS